jgi:hypothetical protein
LKATLKILLYAGLTVAGLFLFAVIGVIALAQWQYHLPSDEKARRYCEDHRTEFIRFAALLRPDPTPRQIVNGIVEPYSKQARSVVEYRDLMRSIGAEQVFVRPDGSIEFQL